MIKEPTIKDLLDSLAGCGGINYCFLCEIMAKDIKYNKRLLLQLKLVEIYKYTESEKEKHDIGWHQAMTRFVDNGYAAKFAEIYRENITVDEIKKLVFS